MENAATQAVELAVPALQGLRSARPEKIRQVAVGFTDPYHFTISKVKR
jgi:hypothetical protein